MVSPPAQAMVVLTISPCIKSLPISSLFSKVSLRSLMYCFRPAALEEKDGSITDSEHFLFGNEEILPEWEEENDISDSPLLAFLVSLYQSREFIPNEILLSFELPENDLRLLTNYVTDRAGHRVTIRTPKRGGSKYLCDMAVSDAKTHSENARKREAGEEKMLYHLASMLQLEVLPQRIEAYDISNLGTEHITAGMVTAIDGKLTKSDYRTFKIKGQAGQDDYAAMRETILRRLNHITADPEAKEALECMPDLILLDGGVGHVHTVREAMSEMGFDIPVFGMVKDEFHKTRTLTDGESEIQIARQMDVFRFIYGLQEEVHRYTVGRMMNAKRKTLKTSTLEKIHGIGPAKAKLLMEAMGSLNAVRNADAETLAEIPGISRADAEAVYTYYRQGESPQKG